MIELCFLSEMAFLGRNKLSGDPEKSFLGRDKLSGAPEMAFLGRDKLSDASEKSFLGRNKFSDAVEANIFIVVQLLIKPLYFTIFMIFKISFTKIQFFSKQLFLAIRKKYSKQKSQEFLFSWLFFWFKINSSYPSSRRLLASSMYVAHYTKTHCSL